MKNIKLLIIMLLFSGLLAGCGMKGPLYHATAKQAATPLSVDKKEISDKSTTAAEKTEQDNLDKSAQ